MGRVTWKENKVISIATENNVFVLAQMLCSPFLLVFNLYSENDQWENVKLSSDNILLCKAVTRQFLKCSEIHSHNIAPVLNPEIDKYWIDYNNESFRATLFKGTPFEIEKVFIGKGGGKLIELCLDKLCF